MVRFESLPEWDDCSAHEASTNSQVRYRKNGQRLNRIPLVDGQIELIREASLELCFRVRSHSGRPLCQAPRYLYDRESLRS